MNENLNSNNVRKWATISLVLLATFLFVRVISDLKRLPTVGREVYPQSTISVTGNGEVYAVPNVGSFSFTVTEAGESVESAQNLLDDKIAKALSSVKDSGVEEKDIKTLSYNVYPKYEWEQINCITFPCPQGKNKLVGYEVSQTISVKIRNTEKAGELVSTVGATGVSNISGLQFEVDDREIYVNQAREEAISKAKEQAKILAKQLGVSLGKVLYFNEGGNYPTPYYAEGLGGDNFSRTTSLKAELPLGENKITSDVTITYEIR